LYNRRFLLINAEGWPFIALFAAASLGLAYAHPYLGIAGGVLTVWCVCFFRDPDRTPPDRKGLIIAPADGVVQMIRPAPPPPELAMGDAPRTRVSIFMNVFNVHVNRIPCAGRVTALVYHPGKFFNAAFDKASEHNERQSIRLATEDGHDIAFVQIAGLIARRILCGLAQGQEVRAGERFGMIRFGSRVDVYLPLGVTPLVVEAQKTVAGETVIADVRAGEAARTGERT